MHLQALAGRDKTVHGKSGWFAKGRVCRRQALQNRLESCITACDAVLMRPLPLRVRLTARYFLVLCLAFGAFSLPPFFEFGEAFIQRWTRAFGTVPLTSVNFLSGSLPCR